MSRIKVVACTGEENTAKYKIPQEIIGPGFEVDFVFTKFPVWPDNYVDYRLVQLSILEAAMNAEKEGCAGVFVCDSTDLGVAELRSALKIPVVGGGSAMMHVAASLGNAFSIVTVWPRSVRYWYQEMLDAYKLNDKCVSIRHVTKEEDLGTLGREDSWLKQMWGHQDQFMHNLEEQCRAAINEDGAEVICLGCTCMAITRDHLAERLPVPVLSPVHTGYKLTEMLVQLGLAHSKKTYGHTGPATREITKAMAQLAGDRTTLVAFAPGS